MYFILSSLALMAQPSHVQIIRGPYFNAKKCEKDMVQRYFQDGWVKQIDDNNDLILFNDAGQSSQTFTCQPLPKRE
ncbi:MAG: hypothetical protein ABR89_06135 [Rhodobacter sp. BACL10 MAG-120910-bin24]|nr:MAG: hypothetical protein ABR89_06135 [Rhodobacter sp. BACL10 MAG-120910-bin24]KRP15166.1 MAG: hypothetical protein ABR97_04300 [Rhodobacter sp. BACL10 MAG-120419-bin15]